jgi:hypothetical protein
MGRMRITMRCHAKGCRNWIDESMARLCRPFWYYCSYECAKKSGAIRTLTQEEYIQQGGVPHTNKHIKK